MSNNNDKAPPISSFAIYNCLLKSLLHTIGSGSTGFYSIWRNNIKKHRSQINSNIIVITPNSSLINDTDIIGTSEASIADIVSLSINNTISIDPLNGSKLYEPIWALTQTINLWKLKKIGSSVLHMSN
jgi:hypothetical protein